MAVVRNVASKAPIVERATNWLTVNSAFILVLALVLASQKGREMEAARTLIAVANPTTWVLFKTK